VQGPVQVLVKFGIALGFGHESFLSREQHGDKGSLRKAHQSTQWLRN
jgi:hypothetical protein